MLNSLKIVLSVIALVLGGFVLAGTTGLISMSNGETLFLGGVGSLMAMAGVPLIVVTANLAKVLMVVSGMIGAAVTGYWTHHPAWQGFLGQPWFIVLVKIAAMLGIVAGVLGRSALGRGKPLGPAASLDGPPPASGR